MRIKKVKRCCRCRELIRYDAEVCSYCSSEQQKQWWKPKLVSIGLVLSLAVSVISVSTTLYTISKSTVVDKKVKIVFDIITTSESSVHLLVQNEGNVPGVITRGMISNSREKGSAIAFAIPIESPILVKPGDYKIITIFPYGGIPDAHRITNKNSVYSCSLSLWVMQMGKEENYNTKDFSCYPAEEVKEFLDEIFQMNRDYPRTESLKLYTES
ncbi:hypothetical protein [Photobacterium swingsii]|uniref:hypothetical protein n=1 Tax=Photobacterium swingsii TaxID=680026 RepID=UPI004067BA81